MLDIVEEFTMVDYRDEGATVIFAPNAMLASSHVVLLDRSALQPDGLTCSMAVAVLKVSDVAQSLPAKLYD